MSTDGRFHAFRLLLAAKADAAESVAALANARGWPLRELRRDDRTLEQVFRELTETRAEAVA